MGNKACLQKNNLEATLPSVIQFSVKSAVIGDRGHGTFVTFCRLSTRACARETMGMFASGCKRSNKPNQLTAQDAENAHFQEHKPAQEEINDQS